MAVFCSFEAFVPYAAFIHGRLTIGWWNSLFFLAQRLIKYLIIGVITWRIQLESSSVVCLLSRDVSAIKVHESKDIQSNLGSWTSRIMNSSVQEQIFLTQSVSDDVLCLELRSRKPSTSWSDKLGESPSKQHFTSSPPSTYAVSSPPYRYSKTKLSFRLYLICLVLCLSFLW